jgi:glucan phosphoethanolaminetransferase (alkaline phosphatase superfamily)
MLPQLRICKYFYIYLRTKRKDNFSVLCKLADMKQKKLFYGLWSAMFLLAFTPNLFLFFYDEITFKSALFLLLGVAFCLFPALFLKSKIYFGFYFPFVLLAPLEIGHIIVNKISLTSGFLLTLSSTNTNEIISYLSSFKLMIVFVVIYWILYIFLWIKMQNASLFGKKAKKIALYFYLLLFIGIILLAIFSLFIRAEKPKTKEVFYTVPLSFRTKFNKTYPYNFLLKTYNAISEKLEIIQRLERVKDFTFNPLVKDDEVCEIYVFVMGESARYSNFGFNGYERNTTPFLSSLKKEGNLFVFSNVFASGNLTNNTLPFLMTRATVLEKQRANEEKSLITLFHEAGFKTYVLSNQGEGEPFLRQLALEADYGFVNKSDASFDEKYDGLLLPQIDSILNEKVKKKCLFLFTLGSHYKYNFRYPSHFEKFTPTIAKTFFTYEMVEKNKALFVNAYDNSVLYTDFFIHEVIKRIENQNCKSTLFYISDHGENIFDTPEVNIGHGTLHPTKQELHVPMFIWFSDSYLQTEDSVVFNLKNNLHKMINSSHVFHTFANIAGIKYGLYQKERDISTITFQQDSVRWVLNPDLDVIKIKE